MVYSMTGYGRGEGRVLGVGVAVEIRSLNNRFLDMSIRTPRKWNNLEDSIRELVTKEISRGKIEISVQITDNKRGPARLRLNEEILGEYKKLFAILQAHFNMDDKINIGQILNLPDLLAPEEDIYDYDEFGEGLAAVILAAVKNLKTSQRKEANVLVNDAKKRIKIIQTDLKRILLIIPGTRKKLLENLRAKVMQLAVDPKIVKMERLELEVALLSEKSDITEECVRLQSHLTLFMDTIRDGGAVGKRLDFVLQEMNRETNTMGAKADSFEISRYVVEIKDEIERIREQIRNLM